MELYSTEGTTYGTDTNPKFFDFGQRPPFAFPSPSCLIVEHGHLFLGFAVLFLHIVESASMFPQLFLTLFQQIFADHPKNDEDYANDEDLPIVHNSKSVSEKDRQSSSLASVILQGFG